MTATADVNSGTVLVGNFITEPGQPAITAIPTGQIIWKQWFSVSTSTGVSQFVMTVFKRNLAGTETNLFSFTTQEIDNFDPVFYETDNFIQTAIPLDVTDRVGTRVAFTTTSVTPVIGGFTHDGTSRQSYVITPIAQGVSGYTGSQGTIGYVGSQGNIGYIGSGGASQAQILRLVSLRL